MHRILDALNRIPGCFAWENVTGGILVGGRIVKRKGFQITGGSDVIAVLAGRFIGLEIKTPARRGNTSPAQEAFISKIRRCGGVAEVVTSVEEAMEVVRGLV